MLLPIIENELSHLNRRNRRVQSFRTRRAQTLNDMRVHLSINVENNNNNNINNDNNFRSIKDILDTRPHEYFDVQGHLKWIGRKKTITIDKFTRKERRAIIDDGTDEIEIEFFDMDIELIDYAIRDSFEVLITNVYLKSSDEHDKLSTSMSSNILFLSKERSGSNASSCDSSIDLNDSTESSPISLTTPHTRNFNRYYSPQVERKLSVPPQETLTRARSSSHSLLTPATTIRRSFRKIRSLTFSS